MTDATPDDLQNWRGVATEDTDELSAVRTARATASDGRALTMRSSPNTSSAM